MQEKVRILSLGVWFFSSEDIGNADPNALNLAVSTLEAVKNIGYPEARIILAQCVVYLASTIKSNASYKAINEALNYVKNNEALEYLIILTTIIKKNKTIFIHMILVAG